MNKIHHHLTKQQYLHHHGDHHGFPHMLTPTFGDHCKKGKPNKKQTHRK